MANDTKGSYVTPISSAMPALMAEIGAVAKARRAPQVQGGYEFRGIDDVMAALQPALIKVGVSVVPVLKELRMDTYTTERGRIMNHAVVEVEYLWTASDGTKLSLIVPGEGSDTGDKAVSKAMASAMKYGMTQGLCIPTEELKDSEHGDPEPRGFEEYAGEGEVMRPTSGHTPPEREPGKITRNDARLLAEHAFSKGKELEIDRDAVTERMAGYFEAVELPIDSEKGRRSSLDLSYEQYRSCWLWIDKWSAGDKPAEDPPAEKTPSDNELAAQDAESEANF